jgi:hypothetical protein
MHSKSLLTAIAQRANGFIAEEKHRNDLILHLCTLIYSEHLHTLLKSKKIEKGKFYLTAKVVLSLPVEYPEYATVAVIS